MPKTPLFAYKTKRVNVKYLIYVQLKINIVS